MKYKIIRQTKRGSQYEIWYDILDDKNKLIVGGLQRTVGVKLLTTAAIDKLMTNVILANFSQDDLSPAIELSEEDVVKYLYDNDYLAENETLINLKKKVSINGNF